MTFNPILLQRQALYPCPNALCRSPRRKTLSCQPVSSSSGFCKQLPTLSQIGAGRGAERNHCFSCKIICCNKPVHRPRCNMPPDRIFFCQVWTKKNLFFCFHYILKSHNRELHKLLCSNNLKVITFETPRIINEQNPKLCSFIINYIKNPTHFFRKYSSYYCFWLTMNFIMLSIRNNYSQ